MPDARRGHRLFFALWPSDVLRRRIAAETGAAVARSGGKPVPAPNLHVTLFFLGQVFVDQLPGVIGAAAGLSAPSFEIVFDRIEVLRRSHVLCLSAQETPQGLLELFEGLCRALQPHGYAPDRRRYQPHVTLARDVPRQRAAPVAADDPREAGSMREPLKNQLSWLAIDFALVESTQSQTGSQYSVLARWPLRASAGA